MASCLYHIKVLPEVMLTYHHLNPPEQTSMKITSKYNNFHSRKCMWKHLQNESHFVPALTHWGWVKHKCVGNLTIIGWDNGSLPGRRQAIIWTNAGILLIGPLGTNFSLILIEIHKFSFKKMHLKVSSAKWRLCCLGLNMLTWCAGKFQNLEGRGWIHYELSTTKSRVGRGWCFSEWLMY